MLDIDWKKLRRKEELTQVYLANKASLSQQAYQNYEAGVYSPRLDTALDLLSILGYELKLVKIEKGE